MKTFSVFLSGIFEPKYMRKNVRNVHILSKPGSRTVVFSGKLKSCSKVQILHRRGSLCSVFVCKSTFPFYFFVILFSCRTFGLKLIIFWRAECDVGLIPFSPSVWPDQRWPRSISGFFLHIWTKDLWDVIFLPLSRSELCRLVSWGLICSRPSIVCYSLISFAGWVDLE